MIGLTGVSQASRLSSDGDGLALKSQFAEHLRTAVMVVSIPMKSSPSQAGRVTERSLVGSP